LPKSKGQLKTTMSGSGSVKSILGRALRETGYALKKSGGEEVSRDWVGGRRTFFGVAVCCDDGRRTYTK
jgi:hypothetical protein